MTLHPPTKSALRQSFLERRLQMLPNDRANASQAIFEAFFKNVQMTNNAIVAGYWPIKAEVDVMLILRELLGKGHRCALPHVASESAPLLFRHWDEKTKMVTGKLGIHEPATGSATLIPDIMLVPLLAFDTKGHRLGYGAGFYDRTIARLKKQKSVRTIGLAYEMQMYGEIPKGENDVKIDMIITDRNIYK